MNFDRSGITDRRLIKIYRALLTPRMIEEKMLKLLRQGQISKWFSGIGQEAISVGVCLALRRNEYILPMHRNLGIFTTRGIPLDRLFAQFQGKKTGYTKGRDRSFHFGSKEHHIIGMISHLGPQLGVADGIALSHLLNHEKKVVLVFCGDGGASEGDFHEAMNVASVWNLPVLFFIENNGYGLSTPSIEQFNHQHFIDKGHGYGMEAHQIDGNNVLEVYQTVKKIARRVRRKHRPILLEAITFRMRGHEEASGTKYIPKELLEKWALRDPIDNFEKFLFDYKILNREVKEKITTSIRKAIDRGLEKANADNYPDFNEENEYRDVYAPHTPTAIKPRTKKKVQKRFVDAICDGLDLACEKYPQLILMGQDIAEYGGVFKVTEGLVKKYGKARVRNTPLCESAILGASLGLSIAGMKSMVEMQFADFVSSGFTQIINNLAKVHYRWGQNADVVIRMPTGAGVNAGPFHSQSNEAWFMHTPGLKVVYPSTPYDAKGLLLAAFEDPNPVMFFEHKKLYRSIREEIPVDYYTLPLGKAEKIVEGNNITIITYGFGVVWTSEIIETIPQISIELIDLRTLMPWDKEMVSASVKKTGKVIIFHEATITSGIGAEISAYIAENLFEYLDGPVIRVGSLDTPVPFINNLEENFLPPRRFKEKLLNLAAY
jgi:2-oxoisovalerate dehydrogenase E1 component